MEDGVYSLGAWTFPLDMENQGIRRDKKVRRIVTIM
jgi:hypothetical protein